MRTDRIKMALDNQAFMVDPRMMSSALSLINNGGLDKVQTPSVEQIANNTVTYEEVGSVAVISLDGVMYKKDIGGLCANVVSYDQMVKAIDKAEANDAIDTILFRVDTAGGSVAGADEVGDRIYTSPKKTITLFENQGTSGGVYVFTASDEVYATETTILGSIGVIVTFIKDEEDKSIAQMASKNAKNKMCDLEGDCLEKVQKRIDQHEEIFYDRIMRNTGFSAEQIIDVFNEGDTIFATEAYENKFIDGISTFKDVLASAVGNTTVRIKTSVVANPSSEKHENSNIGDSMKQEELQTQLDEAKTTISGHESVVEGLNASIDAKDKEIGAFDQKLADASAEAVKVALSAQAENVGQIVAMAYENGATKETALAMIGADSVADASYAMIQAKTTSGASSNPNTNVQDPVVGKDEAKEAHAVKIAEQIAKNIGGE